MAIRKNSSPVAHPVRVFLPHSARLRDMSAPVSTNTIVTMRADSVLRASVPVCRARHRSARAIVRVSREEAILSARAISPVSKEAIVLAIIRMVIISKAVTSSARPTDSRKAATVVLSRVATSSARAAIVSAPPITIPMQSTA